MKLSIDQFWVCCKVGEESQCEFSIEKTPNKHVKIIVRGGLSELCHRETLSINQLLVGWKLGEESLCELHIANTSAHSNSAVIPKFSFDSDFEFGICFIQFGMKSFFFHLDELSRLGWFRETLFGTDFVHGNFVNFQLFIYAKSSLSAILTAMAQDGYQKLLKICPEKIVR